MKFVKIFMLLVVVLTAAFTSQAQAEQKIAVVDTRVLMVKSKAAEDVAKQLKKISEDIFAKLGKREKSLREEERKVIESRANSSEEEFVKKAKAFEEKRIAFQKDSEGYRRKINEATYKAEKTLTEEITKTVASIAGAQGYDLVITKQNVILGAKSIDLTEAVMKDLNKNLTKLKVEYSEK